MAIQTCMLKKITIHVDIIGDIYIIEARKLPRYHGGCRKITNRIRLCRTASVFCWLSFFIGK